MGGVGTWGRGDVGTPYYSYSTYWYMYVPKFVRELQLRYFREIISISPPFNFCTVSTQYCTVRVVIHSLVPSSLSSLTLRSRYLKYVNEEDFTYEEFLLHVDGVCHLIESFML